MTGGRFRATTVKIMQDGVAENGTAAMLTPYLDRCGHADRQHRPLVRRGGRAARRDRGRSTRPASRCTCTRSATAATREALDAFECLDGLDNRDMRHQIAHLQLVHPDDVRRFAGLGVAANLQMLWACLDDQMVELTIPFLGEERSRWQYPFGDLHRAGARLVAGSDWPVSTPDPLAGDPGRGHPSRGRGPARQFLPEQALALETAWAAYTSGSCVGEPPARDDAGRAAPGSGRGPGGARPRPVRGARRRDRRRSRGVDLDRRNPVYEPDSTKSVTEPA